MPRYVAFLRGVSPTNASMPALAHAFEAAGFTDVCTILSSGNVAFSARNASDIVLSRRAETAMRDAFDKPFATIVRPSAHLQALLAANPFAAWDLPPEAKRVVTFLRAAPAAAPALPIERDGARILARDDREVFTAYVRHPKGPVFMTLLEQTFGREITTRTWDTVRKVATA